jgi:biotin carboxyl carrier protein
MASVAVTRPREAPTVRLPPEERAVAVTRPADAPTVPALPSALTPGVPPASAGARAGVETGSAPSWAIDLDGALGTTPGAPAGGALKPGGPVPQAVPGAPTSAANAPAGMPERRQPPGPEAVVMSGFTDVSKNAAARKRGASRMVLVLVLVAAVVAAVVGYLVMMRQRTPAPLPAVSVRVLSPKPTTVYRWFSGRGVVDEDDVRTLGFDTAGRLAELLPAGAEFSAGETVGRLQQAAAVETLLAHHRSRLAFYGQMRDSMQAAGNGPEARQAELRLADKQRLVDETAASLAHVTLRASEPGEVVETLAKVGTSVKAGAPIARVKGKLLHGAFDLDADELAASAGLRFCRVEVIGLGPRASNSDPRRPSETVSDSGSLEAQAGPRFVDCARPTATGGKLEVALPGDLGLVPGQPLRLARRRFDAVFPVPPTSVTGATGEGTRRSIWIATPEGLAARREVTVVEVGDEALVSEGLAVGDQVIVDAPAALATGVRITIER